MTIFLPLVSFTYGYLSKGIFGKHNKPKHKKYTLNSTTKYKKSGENHQIFLNFFYLKSAITAPTPPPIAPLITVPTIGITVPIIPLFRFFLI